MHYQQWDDERYLSLGTFLRNNFTQALDIIETNEPMVAVTSPVPGSTLTVPGVPGVTLTRGGTGGSPGAGAATTSTVVVAVLPPSLTVSV